MLESLRWLGPPVLAQPDLNRRARALWVVSWSLLGVVAVTLALAVVVEPETLARRATTIAAVGALVIVLHVVSRGGRPLAASWTLVIGLSIIVTQRAWITGGIHAPVAVFYVLFIILAGLLIGTRGGVVTAAVCVAGAGLLTAGTAMEWLTPRPGAGSALGGLVFVLLAIGLALVLQALASLRPRRGGLDPEAVQMIVHDMRSPLHAVLAHLELLRDDVRGQSAKDVEGAIGSVASLHRMTTSLLDVSRLQSDRMPVRKAPTDLRELARSVVASLRALQPSRHIAVQAQGEVICNCDPEITRRIVENLVSNAIKHTPPGGAIRVRVYAAKDRARIAVHDEGPGIPKENRALIFEPYSAQGLRSASGFASSGLGLAFCKLAAEEQGGSIRIEDGDPSGSVFIVDLPR